MHVALGAYLLVHGLAHLVGFLGPWHLSAQVPSPTTVLAGRFDAGEAGAKALGLLWLLTSAAFTAVAAGALVGAAWWPAAAVGTALVSLALCVARWPEAELGALVDVALIAGVLAASWAGWPLVQA